MTNETQLVERSANGKQEYQELFKMYNTYDIIYKNSVSISFLDLPEEIWKGLGNAIQTENTGIVIANFQSPTSFLILKKYKNMAVVDMDFMV